MWRLADPQGSETNKVKHQVVHYTRGKGLDIGCGPWKGYAHWIGVDNMHHANEFGWQFRPDIVSEADNLGLFADKSLDFVYSSHTLEHVVKPKECLAEWWRVIKPGGHLILYLPHADLYPNIGQPGSNPDHKSDFRNKDITNIMKSFPGWDLVVDEVRDYDHGEGDHRNEYSFLQVYRKTEKNSHYYSCRNKPAKRACVVRYGGFGDMIQASSVFPELKKQGYHVTMMCTPRGHDILKHDPNIDEFIVQDTDQVPNNELTEYWDSWKRYFQKWVNLSESVEATLLATEGRANHGFPKALRHKIMNFNYLEFTHDIAEVPHEFHARFHATDEEIVWAKAEREKMNAPLVVVWSLSGSSLHKVSPYVDSVIASLMLETDVHVVLVGDYACQILEGASWDNEPRVHCRSGVWEIRQSLAFAKHAADIVVGPETGLLNAVGLEPVRKVIALSHSTDENLTKYWDNYIALTSRAKCYPCHQMQYGKGTCLWVKMGEDTGPSGETEAVVTPACTFDIGPEMWFDAITYHISEINELRGLEEWPPAGVPITA